MLTTIYNIMETIAPIDAFPKPVLEIQNTAKVIQLPTSDKLSIAIKASLNFDYPYVLHSLTISTTHHHTASRIHGNGQ
jgi:hypothetical protein